MPNDKAPARYDWSGAYAGVHLGYGRGKSDYVDSEYNGLAPFPVVNWEVKSKGPLAGLHAGYNWQRENIVFGVEGEIGRLKLKGESLPPGVDPILNDPYDASGALQGGGYASLSARLGYASNRTLFYTKAGAVYTSAKLGFADNCITSPCGPGTINASAKAGGGYLLGAGVEHALSDKWTVKTEYTYFDFGNRTITGIGGAASNGILYHVGSALSVHTVKIGLNYRF